MKPESFPKEIIGLDTLIIESTNFQIVGIRGTIVNETKYMITIKTDKGLKSIPKKDNKWKLFSKTNEINLDGISLVGRAEDRKMINQ